MMSNSVFDNRFYEEDHANRIRTTNKSRQYRSLVFLNVLGLEPYLAGKFHFPRNCDWDEVLFDRFRFEFDPTWSGSTPRKTYEKCVQEWATRELWDSRAWGPDRYPLCPSSTPKIGIPSSWSPSTEFQLEHRAQVYRYNKICSHMRQGFKIFPDMLAEPRLWKKRHFNLMDTMSWLEEVKIFAKEWPRRPPTPD